MKHPLRIMLLLTLLLAWVAAPELMVRVPVDPGFSARAGAVVPARAFDRTVPGRTLALAAEPLVLSNSPEFPNRPGILLEVGDLQASAGRFRLLYSHDNLLYDLTDPRVDDPATVGFAIANHTGRAVSLFWTRRATVRTTDAAGAPEVSADLSPTRSGGQRDYGGGEGSILVRRWFRSGDGRSEHFLARLAPGGVYLYHEGVGPGSWAMGLFDFVLRDAATGAPVTGGVGVDVLIARGKTGFASFYRRAERLGLVLPAADSPGVSMPTAFHQRGVFAGADRTFSVRCGTAPVVVQVAQLSSSQNVSPHRPGYEPDMFVNDVSYGWDQHPATLAEDSGDYGVEYVLRLELSGPVAVAVQPAQGRTPVFEDMYDQHLVFDLDGDVRAVSFRDPHYADYFRSPRLLTPLGRGKVVYVVTGRTALLRTMLPPNGYGPFKILITPVPR